MTLIGFALSAGLLLSWGVLASAWLRLPTRAAYLLSVYLLVVANIVLTVQVAGTIGVLDSRAFFLALEGLFAALAAGLWLRAGRPPLAGPFAARPIRLDRGRRAEAWARWPELVILVVLVTILFLFQGVLALAIPQNIDDVLTTHLARVGYWLQSGSLDPWDTSDYNTPQVIYPLDLSAQLLWSVLFWGSDRLVGLLQWVSAPLTAVAIYGLARLLHHRPPQALFVAFLWFTLPAVTLQLTHALTDVMSTTLFLAMLYLFFLGMRAGHRGTLALSGVGLGLALGVRQSIIFTFPGLALVGGVMLWQAWRHDRRRVGLLVWWGAACMVAFALLGAYIYVSNVIHFDHPLGPPDSFNAYTRTDDEITPLRRVELLGENTLEMTAEWLISLLPAGVAIPLFESRLGDINVVLDLTTTSLNPLSESYSWFGLAGLLVLPFIVRAWQIRPTRSTILPWSLLVIGLSSALVLFASRNFSPAMARYLIVSLSTLLPLAASMYRRGRAAQGLVLIGICTMVWTIGADGSRRAFKLPTMLAKPRVDAQTVLMKSSADIMRDFDRLAPEDGTVGLLVERKFPHSPLFGPRYTRRVEVLHEVPAVLDRAWMAERELDVVLLDELEFSTRIDESVCVAVRHEDVALLALDPPDDPALVCLPAD